MFSGEKVNKEEGAGAATSWDDLKSVPFNPNQKQQKTEETSYFGEDPYQKMHQENADKREEHQRAIERARNDKEQYVKTQHIQEVIERDLNSRIMSVKDLCSNEGAEMRTIPYGEKQIEVIEMKGAPYRMLLTDIGFKTDSENADGHGMAMRVLADPSLWNQNREEAEKDENFGKKYGEFRRGDTICTSYVNSEANANSFNKGEVVYGFDAIRRDSVIRVANKDNMTASNIGSSNPSIHQDDLEFVSKLERGQTNGYNEITLRRYDENGKPLKPSYIVVVDGKITDTVMRHADYWGIPIINIESQTYRERLEKKGKAIIDSIDENISFIELEKKLEEYDSVSEDQQFAPLSTEVGYFNDATEGGVEERKRQNIRELEIAKSLEYLKGVIEDITKRIDDDTENGVVSTASASDYGLDKFDVVIYEKDGRHLSERGESQGLGYLCNKIVISMRNKEIPFRPCNLSVYDGERTTDDYEITGADSSAYDSIEPVIRKYFEARRRNDQLKVTAA